MKCVAFFLLLFSQCISSEYLYFEDARLDQIEFLTQLGLDSNAYYGYRSVSDKEARKVFLVTEEHISKGIVRILKRDEEIIGFYGIMTHNEGGNEMNILSHLFLIPEEIGKGYGKILFNEAMRAAREELHWSGLLWESDPKAAWFYKKMGAKMIGRNLCPLNPDYRAPIFIFILDR